MTRQTQGIIGVTAAQVLLGTLGVCVLESGADPVSIAFYRCAIGGLVLMATGAWRGDLPQIPRLPPRVLGLAVVSGVLMVGNWVLFFEAIQRTSIAIATIVFHIQPFFMVVLGAIVFRERLRAVTLAWIALALLGLGLAIGLAGTAPKAGPYDPIGIACALGGAFLYSLVTIVAKGVTGIKAPQLTLVQCLCGTLLLAAVLPLEPLQVSSDQWGWFALIGVVHTGGVYVLLYNALPKLATPLAAVLLFFYPASAILTDAMVYGHTIGWIQYAGFACILTASLGVTLKRKAARPLPAQDGFPKSDLKPPAAAPVP